MIKEYIDIPRQEIAIRELGKYSVNEFLEMTDMLGLDVLDDADTIYIPQTELREDDFTIFQFNLEEMRSMLDSIGVKYIVREEEYQDC
jgi:hypothetical protein